MRDEKYKYKEYLVRKKSVGKKLKLEKKVKRKKEPNMVKVEKLLEHSYMNRRIALKGKPYTTYLKSSRWKYLVETYRKDSCLKCGIKYDLHLHHTSYRRLGMKGESKYLVTLCSKCHKAVHDWASENNLSIKEATLEVVKG